MAKIWLLRAAGGFSAERGSFPAERCCCFPLRWMIHLFLSERLFQSELELR